MYGYAWIASMLTVYVVLATAPLVLGSWIVLQGTRTVGTGLWLLLLLVLLLTTGAIGAIGLYLLAATPAGAITSV